jgi:integrase
MGFAADIVRTTCAHVRPCVEERHADATPSRCCVPGCRTVGDPDAPAFPTRCRTTLSRDAVERLVAKYASAASVGCATLRGKRVTPHVLRHTTAVTLLQAGIDRTVIALWLGHESIETTQIYLDADLATKERALARTAPLHAGPARFRAADGLLAFLNGL